MTPPGRHTTCKEVVELVTAYLDGALTPEDQTRFEQHTTHCPGCRAYLRQFRLTVQSLPSAREEPVEPGSLEELVRAFRHTKPPVAADEHQS
jgi:anti-sigma factor RsiW